MQLIVSFLAAFYDLHVEQHFYLLHLVTRVTGPLYESGSLDGLILFQLKSRKEIITISLDIHTSSPVQLNRGILKSLFSITKRLEIRAFWANSMQRI